MSIIDRGATPNATLYRTNETHDHLYQIDLLKLMKTPEPKYYPHYPEMRKLRGKHQQFLQDLTDNLEDDDHSYNDHQPTPTTNTHQHTCQLASFEDFTITDDTNNDEDLAVPQPPPLKRQRQSTRISRDKLEEVIWFHKCLGHPGSEPLAQAIDNKIWHNIPNTITGSDVRKVFSKYQCTACELAKRNKPTQGEGSGVHTLYPGDELSIDYQGTINPPSSQGYTGFFLVEDIATGYLHKKFTKSKDANTLIEFLHTEVLPLLL